MGRNAMLTLVKSLVKPIALLAFPKLVYRRMLFLYNREREMDLLAIIVPPGREAVDVGANIGVYSLALSSLATHVHAFEPIPEVAAFIGRVLPRNVTVRNLAVSDSIGELDLFVPIKEGRENTAFASVESSQTNATTNHYRVPATTLNVLVGHDIGFMKIDVEGHEMSVLRGAEELVAQCRPTILVEAEDRHRPNSVEDVFAFFVDRSYVGFFILDDKLMSTEKYHPSMQNIDCLKTDQPRRKSAYVNNFIFIPMERCNERIMRAMQCALVV